MKSSDHRNKKALLSIFLFLATLFTAFAINFRFLLTEIESAQDELFYARETLSEQEKELDGSNIRLNELIKDIRNKLDGDSSAKFPSYEEDDFKIKQRSEREKWETLSRDTSIENEKDKEEFKFERRNEFQEKEETHQLIDSIDNVVFNFFVEPLTLMKEFITAYPKRILSESGLIEKNLEYVTLPHLRKVEYVTFLIDKDLRKIYRTVQGGKFPIRDTISYIAESTNPLVLKDSAVRNSEIPNDFYYYEISNRRIRTYYKKPHSATEISFQSKYYFDRPYRYWNGNDKTIIEGEAIIKTLKERLKRSSIKEINVYVEYYDQKVRKLSVYEIPRYFSFKKSKVEELRSAKSINEWLKVMRYFEANRFEAIRVKVKKRRRKKMKPSGDSYSFSLRN